MTTGYASMYSLALAFHGYATFIAPHFFHWYHCSGYLDTYFSQIPRQSLEKRGVEPGPRSHR